MRRRIRSEAQYTGDACCGDVTLSQVEAGLRSRGASTQPRCATPHTPRATQPPRTATPHLHCDSHQFTRDTPPQQCFAFLQRIECAVACDPERHITGTRQQELVAWRICARTSASVLERVLRAVRWAVVLSEQQCGRVRATHTGANRSNASACSALSPPDPPWSQSACREAAPPPEHPPHPAHPPLPLSPPAHLSGGDDGTTAAVVVVVVVVILYCWQPAAGCGIEEGSPEARPDTATAGTERPHGTPPGAAPLATLPPPPPPPPLSPSGLPCLPPPPARSSPS